MSEISVTQTKSIRFTSHLVEHPLFSDGFRPFFPLAALSALGYILFWGMSLSGVISVDFGLEPLLIHRYEMIFGFLAAAMAGFLTTAVPAWSSTPNVAGWHLIGLATLWCLGRVFVLFMNVVPHWLVFGSHIAFITLLALRIIPPLWQARMRHLIWPVLLLGLAQSVTVLEMCLGFAPSIGTIKLDFETGLIIAEGAFAAMVLTALAPISTVIVNKALDLAGDGNKFIPRPPLRRAAMICIGFFVLARVSGSSESLQGWLGLASACAILNILQDWHIRGALGTVYSKSLYIIYWFLAIGLALQAGGLMEILSYDAFVAGRHMLFIGGFSLATLMVLIIAGTRHSGRALNLPILFRFSIIFMILSCLFRSVLPLVVPEIDWLIMAWLSFALCFVLYLIQFLPWAFVENADG
ncbi:NnrS family protein [Cohaesibacter celericrescens]|uniref:NnrS family protein n=1 Tax=Cohaesibacter celericrescens TaxID=2067669 RepID=A0A2N5XQ36_9HYPH|nr:NnrS family protein [Cohaesibacter celericrescens]PLW76540.1 NnrS family protein [Cohaesibacter celericrescens]